MAVTYFTKDIIPLNLFKPLASDVNNTIEDFRDKLCLDQQYRIRYSPISKDIQGPLIASDSNPL
jgi:hypothetical protein